MSDYDDLRREFRDRADELTEAHSPILGRQRAALGAERFALFIQGHAELQAMALFLVMAVTTMPQTGYSDDALDALRQDARDVRRAAAQWAKNCERLADVWEAQRKESEHG